MYPDESEAALRAAQNEREREALIERQERNILRIASRAKHRFVTKSDDEWSVALVAFSKAVDTYDTERGAFLPYAETLIRRSLIDDYRANARFSGEISVSPDVLDGETEEDAQQPALYAAVERSVRQADTDLQDEIEAVGEELRAFGFGFYDLTRVSPQQRRTRQACMRAARALINRPEEVARFQRTRQLPVGMIARESGVSEKVLGKYRRYIVAIVVILTGEYPILAGHIRSATRGEEG